MALSNQFLVRRPFRAGGVDYKTGDVFVGDAAHLRKLIEQRYLTEDQREVPAPVAATESAPEVRRGPGRPRKAAEAASE